MMAKKVVMYKKQVNLHKILTIKEVLFIINEYMGNIKECIMIRKGEKSEKKEY